MGVDTGGTFTDFVLVVPGEPLRTHKVASTPGDPGRAIVEGLRDLGLTGAEVDVVHGTTVALNALLTGRGTDRAALVTNEGFQDLIEIDRQARPELYDPEPERPPPLVGRERRFELAQRSAPDPDDPSRIVELRAPTDAEIDTVCDAVAASDAVSAAVCLL
ncbi:MAG: hydantoinase/oxoprolinase N-terminal domain-containing protein, partial [Planctomycetota bacterium]